MKFGHFDDQNKEYVITTPLLDKVVSVPLKFPILVFSSIVPHMYKATPTPKGIPNMIDIISNISSLPPYFSL